MLANVSTLAIRMASPSRLTWSSMSFMPSVELQKAGHAKRIGLIGTWRWAVGQDRPGPHQGGQGLTSRRVPRRDFEPGGGARYS